MRTPGHWDSGRKVPQAGYPGNHYPSALKTQFGTSELKAQRSNNYRSHKELRETCPSDSALHLVDNGADPSRSGQRGALYLRQSGHHRTAAHRRPDRLTRRSPTYCACRKPPPSRWPTPTPTPRASVGPASAMPLDRSTTPGRAAPRWWSPRASRTRMLLRACHPAIVCGDRVAACGRR